MINNELKQKEYEAIIQAATTRAGHTAYSVADKDLNPYSSIGKFLETAERGSVIIGEFK